MTKLGLPAATVRRARKLAGQAVAPVVELARTHTTVSVERAVLRLAGMTGTDPTLGDGEIPWVNRVVDTCLLYTSPSPRDRTRSRMPSSA